ncbi:hypothetical protein [Erwinia sp. S38]|uniref:gp53-like domain-containing protein n=1 Tax=Erwinia sp. S38 TaxID=2769338 RepID=UPI00190CD614|nr:hypothetical protein [Erwinia sp. S38]MBK0004389.1 hypothetical protein [Erwinia sp. S38]
MQKVGSVTDTADNNGEFTNGNVAQGVPPTILLAEIFNTWQRELVALVEGAGITLAPTNYQQVLQAVKKIVSDAINSGSTTTLPINSGGTGATTATDARTNLGLGSVAIEDTVPVTKGGTGATTAAAARTNLGLGALAEVDTAPITRGGTGATTASGARTNLSVYSTGEVYSRTESDSRYNKLNAGFFAPTNGRHQDGSTGFMIQVGRVTRTADQSSVTFPQAFPNACIGVVMTKNENAVAGDSTSNLIATNQTVSGFTAVMYENERGATWLAVGY